MTVFELNKEVGKALSNVFLQDNLKEIPDVLYSFKDSLQLLDLSNNLLETLPGDFYVFEKLEIKKKFKSQSFYLNNSYV